MNERLQGQILTCWEGFGIDDDDDDYYDHENTSTRSQIFSFKAGSLKGNISWLCPTKEKGSRQPFKDPLQIH